MWWCDHADCLEELDECFATEAAMREHQRTMHGESASDAPRPLCLHLPRSAVVLQLAAARVPRLVPRTRVYNTSLVRLEQ